MNHLDPQTTTIEENCCETNKYHGKVPENLKENLIKRMNRIEGQVKGIRGMIERDVYCDDILNQMAAVQSALNAVSRLLLESHIHTCVIDRLKQNDHTVVAEFMKTISKLTK
jgi:CsoR family transcriptional regulator, copper-sensing transcriptional repressor